MLMEGFILGLVLCGVIFVLGWVGRMMPLRVLSSLGLVYLSLDYYSDAGDLFCMAMLIALAFALIFVRRDR